MAMDPRFSSHILNNLDKLIELTPYEELMEMCVHTALITPNMRECIEDIEPDLGQESPNEWLLREQHARLFRKIITRGEEAYNHLKLVLGDLECDEAIQLLNEPYNDDDSFVSMRGVRTSVDHENNAVPAISSDGIVCSHCKQEPNPMPVFREYTGNISPSQKLLVAKSQKIHTNDFVGYYTMKSQHNRGLFLCVNIIEFPKDNERRNGAHLDTHLLLDLHRQMNFKCYAYENLSKEEFVHLLNEVIKSDVLKHIECFKMALMTHGNMYNKTEYVQFTDGAVMCVTDILQYFANTNCPALLHKPKIFIFPFCRGDAYDLGYYPHLQHDGMGNTEPERLLPPNVASMLDIFVCYATSPGYRTHRDPDEGSWYVQTYCKIIAEHAHQHDFEDMVKMINNYVAQMRTDRYALQQGTYMNIGFNKKLYFNPGIWMDDEDGVVEKANATVTATATEVEVEVENSQKQK